MIRPRLNARLPALLATIVAFLSIMGCAVEESVSIAERAQRFMRDLDRNDWGVLYTHVHPDEDWREDARLPGIWTTRFPEGVGRYKYSMIEISSSMAVVTLSGDPPGEFDAGDEIILHMRADGDVWYIRQIDHRTSSTTEQLLPP